MHSLCLEIGSRRKSSPGRNVYVSIPSYVYICIYIYISVRVAEGLGEPCEQAGSWVRSSPSGCV